MKTNYAKFLAYSALAIMSGPILRAQDATKDEAALEVSLIDGEAIAIINSATTQLAEAKQFAVTAEIWKDITLEDGGKAQFTKLVNIRLRRPDKLRVDVSTTVPKRSFYFDGKELTVLGHENGFFGTVAAPATIDEMLKAVEEKAGVTFPLEDLLLSKPFGDGAKLASTAYYHGLERVLGVNCHHLTFRNETIDWQVWVEDGVVPIVSKVVINFKNEEGAPQFTAIFSNWDFATPLGDHLFSFTPPEGATKLDMIPPEDPDTEGVDE